MEEEILRDIVQRLARLEEAVTNHLPSQIGTLRAQVKSVDSRVWALLALGLAALLAAVVR